MLSDPIPGTWRSGVVFDTPARTDFDEQTPRLPASVGVHVQLTLSTFDDGVQIARELEAPRHLVAFVSTAILSVLKNCSLFTPLLGVNQPRNSSSNRLR